MFFNKKSYIYFFLFLSLLVGNFFNEDSSGGGRIDYEILFPYAQNFAQNFINGFDIYGNKSAVLLHSPIFSIILSLFLKVNINIFVLKTFYIFVSAILPFILYLILQKNFKIKNDYIFFISLIIFISPYFRSSGIWLLGDNLSLILFSLSIYFFLNTINEKKKLNNYFLCLFFLIICSYVRYYYSLYAIYYLIFFYQNLSKKIFFQILLFGFILSLPALFYLFFIIENYNFFDTVSNFGTINIYSNFLLILSIILFYLVPIIFSERIRLISYLKENIVFFSFALFVFFLIYIIDRFNLLNIIYFSPRGGGVFLKLFDITKLDLKLFISLVAFISFIFLDFLFQKKRLINYFLLSILLLSLPLFTIYQKYLDPLIFLLIFGLFRSEIIKDILENKKINLFFYFFYFFSFYLFSLIYHSKVVQNL